MRKGMLILDRNIKQILENIREKARIACKEMRGTSKEEAACDISKRVQKIVASDPEEVAQHIEDIGIFLKSQISGNPENKNIITKINLMISEENLTKKIQILEYVVGYVIAQMQKENKELTNNSSKNNKDQARSKFIDSFATRAGFIGLVVLELLNVVHPLNIRDHIICLSVIVIFFIFSFIKYKEYKFIYFLKTH